VDGEEEQRKKLVSCKLREKEYGRIVTKGKCHFTDGGKERPSRTRVIVASKAPLGPV
jgi:hypothetical protein